MRVALIASFLAAIGLVSAQQATVRRALLDESDRRELIYANPPNTARIVRALIDPDTRVRQSAARTLREMSLAADRGEETERYRSMVVAALASAARDSMVQVRNEATESLIAVLRNRGFGLHGEAYSHPSEVQPLVDLGPPVLPFLIATTRTNDDRGTRLTAIRALARIRSKVSLEALLDAIAKEEGVVLRNAMEGAILYDDPRVIPAIIAHPGWGTPDVGDGESPGQLALQKIGKRAVPEMIAALSASPDVHVRWVLIETFAVIVDPRARPLLIAALQDSNPDLAYLAGKTLSRYPHPTVVTALSQATKGASRMIRSAAREALMAMPPIRTKPR